MRCFVVFCLFFGGWGVLLGCCMRSDGVPNGVPDSHVFNRTAMGGCYGWLIWVVADWCLRSDGVPDSCVFRASTKAFPLDHRSQEHKLAPFSSVVYSVHVPAEACVGLSDTLRAEVMGENSVTTSKSSLIMPPPPHPFPPFAAMPWCSTQQLSAHLIGC